MNAIVEAQIEQDAALDRELAKFTDGKRLLEDDSQTPGTKRQKTAEVTNEGLAALSPVFLPGGETSEVA